MNINAKEIILGKNVVIESTAVIRGIDGDAKRIVIGDNTYIGNDVQIICDDFEMGDYCKIHHHTNIHGYKPCKIGNNCWIGQYTIIDSIGGTTIDDNCGIGAHSQLWSHIKYGDTLEGNRFSSDKELLIGKDVWFVGHCIISPIIAEDRAMCLVGSVVTKNLKYNRIYGGNPAIDLTDKIGTQFIQTSIEYKFNKMKEYLEYVKVNKIIDNPEFIKIVRNNDDINYKDDISYFNVDTRKYTKKKSEDEIKFMKYLLYDKAKFSPFKIENVHDKLNSDSLNYFGLKP